MLGITYPLNGSTAPRVGECETGDGKPMPLPSTGPHEPLVIKLGQWLRTKPLYSIMEV
mgnify:CR=1 FL=1